MAYFSSGTSVVSSSISCILQRSHLLLQIPSHLKMYGNPISTTCTPSPMRMSPSPEDVVSFTAPSNQSTFLPNTWDSNVRETGIENYTLSEFSASEMASEIASDQAQPSQGLILEQPTRPPKDLAGEEYQGSSATPASSSPHYPAGPSPSTGFDDEGASAEILGYNQTVALPNGKSRTLPLLLTDQRTLHQGNHSNQLFCTIKDCPRRKGRGFGSKDNLERHEKRHFCSYSGCGRYTSDVMVNKAHMRTHRTQKPKVN